MKRPVSLTWQLAIQIILWGAVALFAFVQLGLLASAIAGRFAYPYDLEWMEGGLLHHAQRIREGQGIYVPPSIDFIPYLYTPIYPTMIALFGVSYRVGRAISILGLFGIGAIAIASLASLRHQYQRYGPALAGIALALGLFAAVYPYVEGWYDLVRADTFFLFMITAGLAGMPRWARLGTGIGGHARVAAGATILALAFFCKQTGVIYVALGGAIVLVLAWRRTAAYVATAAAIGLGGTLILNLTTQGWFWTYVSEIHRAHDFNMDRFYKSFGNILWHFPLMTIVVVAALVLVAATTIVQRVLRRPVYVRQTEPLLLWSAAFAVSTVVGAVGWGTEFAHFNAYMPAFLHGALAAGAALPAVYACVRTLWHERPHGDLVATAAAVGFAIPLAYTCYAHRWAPEKFIPKPADVAAGDRLVKRIREIEGEVWMPSHPWYLHLAGKTPRVHRMGIKDVTVRKPRPIAGLDEVLRAHRFAALVLDERDVHLPGEVGAVTRNYRAALKLPSTPARPPQGARVLFDFEGATWERWTRSGAAWGNGPVSSSVPGQGLVYGASGARFATSMHGGDAALGRMTTPEFPLDMARITARLGGGTDGSKLYLELRVEDQTVGTATVPLPGGDTLREVSIAIPPAVAGQAARIVLVDESTTGHLTIDDIWAWAQ